MCVNSYHNDPESEEELPIREELSAAPGNDNTHPPAKDQSVWYCFPQTSGRTPSHNIIRGLTNKVILPPGTTIEDPVDAFRLIFPDNLLSIITDMTNNKAIRVHTKNEYKKVETSQ